MTSTAETSMPNLEELGGLDGILGQLADDMRLYDQLKLKQAELFQDSKIANRLLDGLDLELSASDHPAIVAQNALGLLLANRRLEAAGRSIVDMEDGAPRRAFEVKVALGNTALSLKSIDPKSRSIATSVRNRLDISGVKVPTGDYQATARGQIDSISLDPVSGGAIQIKSDHRRFHWAQPLIDRDNDYAPFFTIDLA